LRGSEGPVIESLKDSVRAYWNAEPCGTRGIAGPDRRAYFDSIERERYATEPYIPSFARFDRARGRRLLEIGVGAGTDFVNWVRGGAIATGVDLTEQGVRLTRERVEGEGLHAHLEQADAESLPFKPDSFDFVYSFGVLHHSPDTPKTIGEVHRVLRPGGTAVIMLYHCYGWVGLTLWAAKLRPWKSPRWAIAQSLESPDTKSYTVSETRALFNAFTDVKIRRVLSSGDLLLMPPSSKWPKAFASVVWKLYPRWLVRLLGDRFGTNILIEAKK
jgi:SAM-dependent methyltransferase